MSLLELFMEYGDPRNFYTDEVVGAFYRRVDDGSFFAEALAEMPDADRARLISLIDDKTSRTLSHQMVGKIVVDQLREYVQSYLSDKYEELKPELRARQQQAAVDEKAELELEVDAGRQSGWMP
jgi:hypothetical protein